MKNCVFFLIFVLLLAFSCDSKSEKNTPAIRQETVKNHLSNVVGRIQGEKFIIDNEARIKLRLEEELSKRKQNLELGTLAIVTGKTEGDTAEDYYILTGSSKEGNIKIAALLYLENNEFYLEERQGYNNEPLYLVIICEGNCKDGCNPIVKTNKDKKSLICSACIDCKKFETEIR